MIKKTELKANITTIIFQFNAISTLQRSFGSLPIQFRPFPMAYSIFYSKIE